MNIVISFILISNQRILWSRWRLSSRNSSFKTLKSTKLSLWVWSIWKIYRLLKVAKVKRKIRKRNSKRNLKNKDRNKEIRLNKVNNKTKSSQSKVVGKYQKTHRKKHSRRSNNKKETIVWSNKYKKPAKMLMYLSSLNQLWVKRRKKSIWKFSNGRMSLFSWIINYSLK